MGDFFLKGLFKKAYEAGLFSIRFLSLRDFASAPHYKVDDYPYGGKRGMVLQLSVIDAALSSIENLHDYRLLYMCPKGPLLTQSLVSDFLVAPHRGLVILVGYYEGVDERLFSLYPFERISIGDFVLSSGELPALVIAEAVVRQIPGVLGNPDSLEDDSYLSGVLEGPLYTQPRQYREYDVPEVLLSGHHGQIATWKRKAALKYTIYNKPQMLATQALSLPDQQLLVEILQGG